MKGRAVPTKTKAKGPIDALMVPAKVSEGDRSLMLECASIDPGTDRDKAKQYIEAVEAALTLNKNMLRRVKDHPLPAHIVAALEPIAKKSAELAELLHPLKLSVAVRHSGTAINDGAWRLLTEINASAELMMAHLRMQDSRGLHRQLRGNALKEARAYLGLVFDAFAVKPSPEDRLEFLKICRRYWPKI